jgi:outer membrane receptor protein involved in Fe transport
VGYIANLGKARVNGADLQINARPLASLLFTLSLSYTDAAYTKNSQVANGYTTVYAGDSILAPPTGVTPWSGSVQARYSFSAHGLPGYVLLDDRAKSHNPGPYTNNPDPLGRIAYDPATNLLNGRLNLSVYGTDVALYCNNILDAHPLLGVANNYLGANDNLFYASTFRPRTLGLTLERKF